VSDSRSLFVRSLDLLADGPEPGRAPAGATQRIRLLEAVTRTVAAKGYAGATVSDVVAQAGVSRRVFYLEYADLQQCFLSAYTTGAGVVLAETAEAGRSLPREDWRGRLRASLETCVAILAAEPAFAKTLVVDILGAGPLALQQRRAVLSGFVAVYQGLRDVAAEEDPGYARASDVALRALVGGIAELIQDHILLRGAASLADLTPTLLGLATSTFESARAGCGLEDFVPEPGP
jgi:AcrR family transcriptional regulator